MLAAKDIKLVQETVLDLKRQGDAARARAIEALLAAATAPPADDATIDPREYLTTGVAANLLGVDRQSIRRWVAGGQMRGEWLGGRLLVHRDSVRVKLEALETMPAERSGESSESIRADRAWQELLLSGLPQEKVARLETLHDKMEDGHAMTRAERAEMAILDREVAAAAAERLKDWISQASASST